MKVTGSMLAHVALVACGAYAGACLAAPYTVQISAVEMNDSGLYVDGTGNPRASDPLFSETVAIIVIAFQWLEFAGRRSSVPCTPMR